MPREVIFRPRALQRRQQGLRRRLPRPPLPEARVLWVLWGLLVVVLTGLATVGHTLKSTLEAAPAARPSDPHPALQEVP